MKNLMKKISSYLSTSRVRKAMVRGLAILVVFSTTYSLVLPAITKAVNLSGELDGISVRIEAKGGVIPADTELILKQVLLPGDPEPEEGIGTVPRRLTDYEVGQILEAALDGNSSMEAQLLKVLDISLEYNGREIEPSDVVKLFLDSDLIREANQPTIVHLDDEGVATVLPILDADGQTMVQIGKAQEEFEPEIPGDASQSVEIPEGTAPVEAPEESEGTDPAETPEEPGTTDPAETPEEPETTDPAETPEEPEGTNPTEAPEEPEDTDPAETPNETETTAPVESSDKGESSETDKGEEPASESEPAPVEDHSEPEDTSESSASSEAAVETDSFSVYAIVDLLPKAEEPVENAVETIDFAGSAGGMDVYVTAPVTAFPEGTTMELTLVDAEDVMDTVSQVVGGEIGIVQAVDITFYNADGEAIEPSEPINVVMRPKDAIDTENSKLVHIGENETSVVENAAFEENQVSFDSGEFSTYVIIITLGNPGEHVYRGDGITVKVTYGSDAGLPEGTEMTIKELKKGSAKYNEYFARTEKALNMDADEVSMENISLEAQLDALLSGGYELKDARFYDIELSYKGSKIEPAAPVNVEITYDDAGAVDAEAMKIVHFADDGTEIITDVNVETNGGKAVVTYEQGSFSVTAAAIANSYGNAGWIQRPINPEKPGVYLEPNEPGYYGRMEIHYGRVKENGKPVFELAYINGTLPGQSGFPITNAASATFKPGTTIEEIINALTVTNPQFLQYCTVVDFMMHDTYVVDDANWAHNGSRAGVTEIWQGPVYGAKTIQVKITRNGGFTGPLVDIATSTGHPMHTYNGVIIDNAANQVPTFKTGFDSKETNADISKPVAVQIRDGGLLMMMGNSHITDSQVSGYGTGVLLTSSSSTGDEALKGGNLELFQQSYIEKMAVGVEQVFGKTRLKDSPNPLGGRNTIGVALSPGQSIGKWIGNIDASQPVPVFLRDIKKWKSGDIVMDSGYIAVDNQSVKVNVFERDKNKLTFENKKYNQTTQTRMGLEYAEGNQELYPVIRFCIGTVLNMRTGEWYATLHDAVLGQNPVMLQGESRPSGTYIADGDTLVFFGDTIENLDTTINYDLNIRSSYTNEDWGNKYPDERAGNACTATLNGSTITVAAGKEVTFGGRAEVPDSSATTGGLTLTGGNRIIQNNGTLNLKSGITLSNAKNEAVYQNGEFHLYEGAQFLNNGTADVTLSDGNHYITLETTNPNAGRNTRVQLEDGQFDGRDVVVEGASIRNQLTKGYLARFPLTNLDEEEFEYIYNETGGPGGVCVLELKRKDSIHIRITKVDSKDQKVLEDAQFTVYKDGTEEYVLRGESNPHTTDKNGVAEFSVREGNFTVKETKAPNGYKGDESFSFKVTKTGGKLTLSGNNKLALVPGTTDTYAITVENDVKDVAVQFIKTDGDKPLAGAHFELYDVDPTKDTNAKPLWESASAEDTGLIKKCDLQLAKTYWLKETATPEGYMPMSETTTIQIQDTEEGVVVTGTGAVKGEKLSDGTYQITVINNPGKPLPNTGGMGTAIFTITGAGLMGVAVLIMEIKRKGRGRA